KGSIANYSYFKLVLNTWATALSRRLRTAEGVDVSVHGACPGPVDTNIARDAPPALKLVLKSISRLFFQTSENGARGLAYLAASPDVEGETNRYLHMLNPKQMDPKCYDPAVGAALWDRMHDVWQSLGGDPPVESTPPV